MLVYVGNDTEENNGLYVLKNSGTNDANVDALIESNWERISQPDSKIAAIKTNADKVSSKLDKDFVTQSSQGTLGEGTTFAARSDNTAEATNVYITGKQIKDFAAAAVSDKGTFADDTALKAAYPTPEDGWSATVLSTGTTWISADGQWTDSGKSNGVTSVNGKSGKVTLVAADIDDVLSDTETDQHIQAAFTADRTDLSTTAKTVVGGINEVKAATTKNAGDITANATAIAGKQDSTINLEIQGATAATVTDALTSLDTALTSTKSTADAAAKADASNITVSTWKDKLGFITASEVPEQVQPDWNAASGKGQILNKPDISKGSKFAGNNIYILFDETNITDQAYYTNGVITLNGSETMMGGVLTINPYMNRCYSLSLEFSDGGRFVTNAPMLGSDDLIVVKEIGSVNPTFNYEPDTYAITITIPSDSKHRSFILKIFDHGA